MVQLREFSSLYWRIEISSCAFSTPAAIASASISHKASSSLREYYTMVRELPAGKGFADVCMLPRPCHLDKPAIVIELKWDKSAVGAIEQIREKQYGNALKDYQGNLLLAGINYNKKTKKHECVIEVMQK